MTTEDDGKYASLKHHPTPQTRADVKAYSRIGVPQDQIAKKIGIVKSTLQKHYREELDEGLADASVMIAGKLMELVKNDNPAAIIFCSRTRLGMKETLVHKHGGDEDGVPIVTANVEMTPEQLKAELKARGLPTSILEK